jgi:hypothetical protein
VSLSDPDETYRLTAVNRRVAGSNPARGAICHSLFDMRRKSDFPHQAIETSKEQSPCIPLLALEFAQSAAVSVVALLEIGHRIDRKLD